MPRCKRLNTTSLSTFSPHLVAGHELLVAIETAIFQAAQLFRACATGSLPLTKIRQPRDLFGCWWRIPAPIPELAKKQRVLSPLISFLGFLVGVSCDANMLQNLPTIGSDPPRIIDCVWAARISHAVSAHRKHLGYASRPYNSRGAEAFWHEPDHPVSDFGPQTDEGLADAQAEHSPVDARGIAAISCHDVSPNPDSRRVPSRPSSPGLICPTHPGSSILEQIFQPS
jgi:hypothetical protein